MTLFNLVRQQEDLPHFSGANLPVDVLIVGTGPVGATFARIIADAHAGASILMIEAGPQLTARPGANVRNITDPEERMQAQLRSQGPTPFAYRPGSAPPETGSPSSGSSSHSETLTRLARPGTYLLTADTGNDADFPAAAASSNVGGMGAHWTCACPRPCGSERIPFIPSAEMDRLLAVAESLLSVRTDIFPPSAANSKIIAALTGQFKPADQTCVESARPVAAMPLACTRLPSGDLHWTGSDTVLGPWADRVIDGGARPGEAGLVLRSETLCRRLLLDGDAVTGALIEHLPSGRQEVVRARFVVVAADSLRSPQLLWASGIRPRALGHYLNEHAQVLSVVHYAPPTGEHSLENTSAAELGVFWVPFRDPEHPFHGQIMPLSVSPIPLEGGSTPLSPALTIALCWFCTKEIQFEDCVEFSDDEFDFYGMPSMKIHYRYTERDRRSIEWAVREEARAAACLGEFIEGQRPALLATGRSLHYQGTIRMGVADDGTSVCGPVSRVWGFHNLFVGGNGVIPTATACNPTLTSVALAVRSAEYIASQLAKGI